MDKPLRTLNLTDFDEKHLGKRLYELTLKTPYYVAQTGAAVTNNYKIPFPHRLVKIEVKHCNASDVDNTDAFTWSWSKQKVKALFEALVSYAASPSTDFTEVFGESYEYPNMVYRFITNTTVNHRIYLTLTIQLTKSWKELEEDES